jgi:nucleoside 2-deoxyribosyltransferase
MPSKRISDLFHIRNRFLRSAHLERDFLDPSALSSYVVTDFTRTCISRMASGLKPRSGQRASCPPRVYLAGGFLSAWQDIVKKAVPEFEYFDPRSHGLKNRAEYTTWDLEAIRRSDYVFAYLEASNPGGYALALEVGYGKALGKCVIVVEEKPAADAQAARYFEMVTEAADASFSTLQEGITFLQQFKVFA